MATKEASEKIRMKRRTATCFSVLLGILAALTIISTFHSRRLTFIIDVTEVIRLNSYTLPPHFPASLFPQPDKTDTPWRSKEVVRNPRLMDFHRDRLEGRLDNIPLYFLQDHLFTSDSANTLCEQYDNDHLVIGVSSDCTSRENRQAIRMTWGAAASELGVPVVFFLGTTLNSNFCPQAIKESIEYRDVVIANFVDSSLNSTLKTVSMLKWTARQCRQKFLLKVTDDVLLNPSAVLKYIEANESSASSTIVGSLRQNETVEGNGKAKLSTFVYKQQVFPDYLTGSGYLISSRLLEDLLSASVLTPYIPLEDVFLTGIVAKSLDIALTHDKRFCGTCPELNACTFPGLFLKENVNGEPLIIKWESLHQPSDC